MKLTLLVFLILGMLVACTSTYRTTQTGTSQSSIDNVTLTRSPKQAFTQEPNQTATPTNAPVSERTQSATDYCEQLSKNYRPAEGYQTYCDQDYGFAFDYPESWKITFVGGSLFTTDPIEVLKAQRFGADDMSNYIRVDSFRNSDSMSLLDQVHNFFGYDYRELPNNDYPSLTLGGQKSYAIMNCWQQDYSAIFLFFQYGKYYTIMELKAISHEGLETNWQIARSLQTPGYPPESNVIPQELVDDSHELLTCYETPYPIYQVTP